MYSSSQSWLAWFLRGVLVLSFLFLLARIFELQIIKGNYYQNLSNNNRIRRIKIPAARGKILARGGEVLSGEKFAHIIGYLSEVNENEVGKVNPECIEKGPQKLGQLIGRSGLEAKYNCILSGIDGEELIEVDAMGNKLRDLGKRNPIMGDDIKTTIDFKLQEKVASEMEDKVGAIVATDAKGEVLSLFSSPTFDPNNVANYLNRSDLPFFNRAISGTYHPGSIFKPLVGIAALEEKVIGKDFKYQDEGKITVNGFDYKNWYFTQYNGREGEIELTKALARSTDTFFYKIGELLGASNISKWARNFGLDKPTGIDIEGESVGLIPTPAWKKRVKKEAWFLGNTYHYAIGQGDLTVTPLAINNAIVAIANGGKLCRTHLLSPSQNYRLPIINYQCQDLKIKKENLELVRGGMEKVCLNGGTAYTFFNWKHEKLACKTGTAQVGTEEETHAWFTLFYPSESPEIVLTVLVEKGGEGSKVAGPIARSIMDAWYLQKNP